MDLFWNDPLISNCSGDENLLKLLRGEFYDMHIVKGKKLLSFNLFSP